MIPPVIIIIQQSAPSKCETEEPLNLHDENGTETVRNNHQEQHQPKNKKRKEPFNCIQFLISRHPILSIVFLHSLHYSRMARVIVFYSGVIGQLMVVGTFFQVESESSNQNSDEVSSIGEVLSDIGMRDVYVAILSTVIMTPVKFIMSKLYTKKEIPLQESLDEQMKIYEKNLTKVKSASVLVICWWLFCMYAITIYAISFKSDEAYLWIFISLLGIVYSLTVHSGIQIGIIALFDYFGQITLRLPYCKKLTSLIKPENR
mmetsp:Transcript_49700/g.57025  ORF Transcript_49700/g.57025 Transcript_49700/m.57025 type:complete len:260 (+) Transcript_49700:449-1228(+)